MKNINLIQPAKYAGNQGYQQVEEGIYRDLNDGDDTCYRVALTMELEDGEDTQYPLEDLLDEYLLYVADFLPSQSPKVLNLEFGGELENVRQAFALKGKRFYNAELKGEDGQTYVKLVIE